ncbi:hypothetical protein DRQ50_11890, partial [bacterium]
MLILTHLLTIGPEWRDSRVVTRSIILDESMRGSREQGLSRLITETRIKAESEVITKPQDQTVVEVIHATSRRADIVFFGLMEAAEGKEAEAAARLQGLAEGLKTTIFVRSAGEFAGRLI